MKKKAIKAKLDKTKKKLVKTKSKLTATLTELESVKNKAGKPPSAAAVAKSELVRKPLRKRSPAKKGTVPTTASVRGTTPPVVGEVEKLSDSSQETDVNSGRG